MGVSSWQRQLTGLMLGLLVLPVAAAAADLQQEIDDCAAIADDGARLVCFDAIASMRRKSDAPDGNQQAGSQAEAASPAAESTVADADTPPRSPPIIAPAPARDKEKEVFVVRLTRCTETSVSGRQVYYLDNGEVWRQSNINRNNVKNCDTPVTIRKDLFGFKMHVPSEDRSIRISPVR